MTYGLKLLQLHPSAVIILSVFTYTCECFVGVALSIALFRHFFVPLINSQLISGGVVFRLQEGAESQFIKLAMRRNWKEWRNDWCLVRVSHKEPLLDTPEGGAAYRSNSMELSPREGEFTPVLERFLLLRSHGWTGPDVAMHFMSRRIAPLQQRSRFMWEYFDEDSDPIRLSSQDLPLTTIVAWIDQFFEASQDPCIHVSPVPLYRDRSLGSILAQMPKFSARGIAGHEAEEPLPGVGVDSKPPPVPLPAVASSDVSQSPPHGENPERGSTSHSFPSRRSGAAAGSPRHLRRRSVVPPSVVIDLVSDEEEDPLEGFPTGGRSDDQTTPPDPMVQEGSSSSAGGLCSALKARRWQRVVPKRKAPE